MRTNPLLEQGHLLAFDRIQPEDATPAIQQLLSEARNTLTQVTNSSTPPTWNDVVAPMQDTDERLSRAWGALGHLMGVMDSPSLREVFNANLPAMTAYSIEVSQNEALFQKYKQIAESEAFRTYSPERRRIIEHALRDFRLSGVELPDKEKQALKALGEEEATLSQQFSEHLIDATNAFTLDFPNSSELSGIPEQALALYKAQAEATGTTGYRITLQYPSYLPAMKYATNRPLREKLYRAFLSRASDLDDVSRDNTGTIRSLLKNRQEEASLLGFSNYAEVSLATKMAKTPNEVLEFLRDLAHRARPYALRDKQELETFAKAHLGIDTLQGHDRSFASEKLREARYAYRDEDVRSYFQLPIVLKGLFSLVERMFDIRIQESAAPVWHPDVQFFDILDQTGHLIAQFYTDLYARPSKRAGAWMDNDLCRAKLADGSIRTPTAYLVCNFSSPVDGKPSLLTHDEVTTLFHEFGHGLHHMLTRVDEAELSGINGVEWDAVEMPSQFMENWAWNYEVLQGISRHVETGASLPRELFDKMLAAKNFQAGLFCVRQIEFALFDMLIHTDYEHCGIDFEKTLRDVRDEVGVWSTDSFDRFAQSFSHIFAGGYSAGYYSYKWAEVLSADAFAAFEEEGLFNPKTGRRWLDEVLSVGGTRDAMESFKAFRGREPRIDALLKQSGMDQPLV